MTDTHEYSGMKKFDIYRAEHDAGLSYTQIAKKYGCSKQNVAQACGKTRENYFAQYTEEQVVYPNLRRWLNENRVSRSEFCRRMGCGWTASNTPRISSYFRGTRVPAKPIIDKMIEVTGLSYEELWER